MELQLLAAAARRSRTLIALLAIVGGLLGLLYSMRGGTSYTASATLLVDPAAVTIPGAQPFTGDPERYIDDQMRIMEGQGAVTAVAAAEPNLTAQDVRKAVVLGHVTGGNAIVISAKSASPGLSARIANGIADTYISERRAATSEVVDRQRDALNKNLQNLQNQLGKLSVSTQNQSARDTLLSQYNAVLSQQAKLDDVGATQDATAIIDRAEAPSGPTRHSPVKPASGGLLAGAVLGAALAVLRQARRPHVVSAGQAEVLAGRTAVAHFTRGSRGSNGAAARRLGTVLAAQESSERRRTVVVCSAGGTEAARPVASALARAFAMQGSQTALIDLIPGQEKRVGAPVTEPTTARADVGGEPMTRLAARRNGPPVMHLHPRNGSTATYSRPVGGTGPTGPDFADSLPEDLDVVVVHCAAVLDDASAAQASGAADSTVLVVEIGSQTEADLRLSLGTLSHVGTGDVHLVTATGTSRRPWRWRSSSGPGLRSAART